MLRGVVKQRMGGPEGGKSIKYSLNIMVISMTGRLMAL